MGILTAIAFLVVAALQATASNFPTISTKGSKFFTNDGNQFFVKGMRHLLNGYWLHHNQWCSYDR
jgi:hypothetical protein